MVCNELYKEYINIFVYSYIFPLFLFLVFLVFKLFEKTLKFKRLKFLNKIKKFNNKFLGFLNFYMLLTCINLYIFLSFAISDATYTNIYGSPLLVIIINISLLVNEIIIYGFKINVNLFNDEYMKLYLQWLRKYIIVIFSLVLDLLVRVLIYITVPKLLLILNYLLAINLNFNIDISSSILFFELALTILFYYYGKYLYRSNFLYKLKYISINDKYNKCINDLLLKDC